MTERKITTTKERLLEGKSGLVTGASSGIGEAIAKRMADEGATVMVVDLNEKDGNRVVKDIQNAGGIAFFHKADVSDPKSVQNIVITIVITCGKLDIGINNAGIAQTQIPLQDIDEALWDRVSSINEKGVFLCLKYEIPALLASGGGTIVNTVSTLELWVNSRMTAYATSKHGVVALTKLAAIENVKKNIRINGVAPSGVSPTHFSTPTGRTGSISLIKNSP